MKARLTVAVVSMSAELLVQETYPDHSRIAKEEIRRGSKAFSTAVARVLGTTLTGAIASATVPLQWFTVDAAATATVQKSMRTEIDK